MGGVSRFDPGGVGRCIGAAGGGGTPSEVPKTSPRSEEAEAQEAERSQDQTCGHGTDLGKTTKVYEMTPLGGWIQILPPIPRPQAVPGPLPPSGGPWWNIPY